METDFSTQEKHDFSGKKEKYYTESKVNSDLNREQYHSENCEEMDSEKEADSKKEINIRKKQTDDTGTRKDRAYYNTEKSDNPTGAQENDIRRRSRVVYVSLLIIFILIVACSGIHIYREYQKLVALRNEYYWTGKTSLLKVNRFDDGDVDDIELIDVENSIIEKYILNYDKNGDLCRIDYLYSDFSHMLYSSGVPKYVNGCMTCLFYTDGNLEHWIYAEFDEDKRLIHYKKYMVNKDYYVISEIYDFVYDNNLLTSSSHYSEQYVFEMIDEVSDKITAYSIEPIVTMSEKNKLYYDDNEYLYKIVTFTQEDELIGEYQASYDKFGGIEEICQYDSSSKLVSVVRLNYMNGNIKTLSREFEKGFESDFQIEFEYTENNDLMNLIKVCNDKTTDQYVWNETDSCYARKTSMKDITIESAVQVYEKPYCYRENIYICLEKYQCRIEEEKYSFLLNQYESYNTEYLVRSGEENGIDVFYDYYYNDYGSLSRMSSKSSSDVVKKELELEYDSNQLLFKVTIKDHKNGIQRTVYYAGGIPNEIELKSIPTIEKGA